MHVTAVSGRSQLLKDVGQIPCDEDASDFCDEERTAVVRTGDLNLRIDGTPMDLCILDHKARPTARQPLPETVQCQAQDVYLPLEGLRGQRRTQVILHTACILN